MFRINPVSLLLTFLIPIFLSSHVFAGDSKNANPKKTDLLYLYVGKIKEKVLRNWKEPIGEKYKGEAVISFYIHPEGNIDPPEVKVSSDVELLDDLALQAILESSPFPPFPKEIKSSNLNITIHFKYTADENFQEGTKRFVPPETFKLPTPQEEENPLMREKRIESLVKSAENRGLAENGLGYKDFYFGDSLNLVEGLKRKHCSPAEHAFMKGDFKAKFDQSIQIIEIRSLEGWCFNEYQFLHFLFNNNNLTRIIWEVSAKPDKEAVLQKYQRLREQLTSNNEHRLTKARSSDVLERGKGQRKTILIDEFDDGGLLLVLVLERNQSEIFVIYQDKRAARFYNKIVHKD